MSGDQAKVERAKKDARLQLPLAVRSPVPFPATRMAEFSSQIKLEITEAACKSRSWTTRKRPGPCLTTAAPSVKPPHARHLDRQPGATDVDNKIGLDGHTDSQATGSPPQLQQLGDNAADRANASRRELIAAGMPRKPASRV